LDSVPLDDRGLLLADGLYETLLWSGGELVMAGPAQRVYRADVDLRDFTG